MVEQVRKIECKPIGDDRVLHKGLYDHIRLIQFRDVIEGEDNSVALISTQEIGMQRRVAIELRDALVEWFPIEQPVEELIEQPVEGPGLLLSDASFDELMEALRNKIAENPIDGKEIAVIDLNNSDIAIYAKDFTYCIDRKRTTGTVIVSLDDNTPEIPEEALDGEDNQTSGSEESGEDKDTE